MGTVWSPREETEELAEFGLTRLKSPPEIGYLGAAMGCAESQLSQEGALEETVRASHSEVIPPKSCVKQLHHGDTEASTRDTGSMEGSRSAGEQTLPMQSTVTPAPKPQQTQGMNEKDRQHAAKLKKLAQALEKDPAFMISAVEKKRQKALKMAGWS